MQKIIQKADQTQLLQKLIPWRIQLIVRLIRAVQQIIVVVVEDRRAVSSLQRFALLILDFKQLNCVHFTLSIRRSADAEQAQCCEQQ